MSQRPFSSHFRRFKPSARSSFIRDTLAEADDMFFEPSSTWNFPSMSSRLGSSVFDTYPRRSSMRSFSSHFDGEPFFRNPPSWMEDDWRMTRDESPSGGDAGTRHSPPPQTQQPQQHDVHMNGTRSGSASPGMKNMGGNPFFSSRFHEMANGIPGRGKHESGTHSDSRSSTPASAASSSEHDCPESPAPPPNVEKHSGVKSRVQQNSAKMPQTAKRQPKVHHIPIHVEPRDGTAPNNNNNNNDNHHHQSEKSTASLRVSPTQDAAASSPRVSPQPPRRQGNSREQEDSPQAKHTSKSTVHIIPVQVTKTKSPSPANVPAAQEEEERQGQSPVQQHPEDDVPSGPIPKSLEAIQLTLYDLEKLKYRVEKFSGTRSDKEYLFLDEMLTRNLIKLDNIVVEGNADLRQARRAAIKEVNSWVHLLESHVISPGLGQTAAPLADGEAEEEMEMMTQEEKTESEQCEETEREKVMGADAAKDEEEISSEMVADGETSSTSAVHLPVQSIGEAEDSDDAKEKTKTFTTSVNVQISDSTSQNGHVTDH